MFRRAIAFALGVCACLALGAATTVAGGGCKVPAGTTEGSGVGVSMKDCTFGPSILQAPVGATVTWLNVDHVPHAVNGLGWDATAPYGLTKPSEKVSHTFAAPGVYPYMCYIHPGMAGVVVVGDVALGAAGSAPAAAMPAAIESRALAAQDAVPSLPLPIAGLLVLIAAVAGSGLRSAAPRVARRIGPARTTIR